MIQRIQTVYLLVALLIIESLFFLPLGEVVVEGHDYVLMFNGFFLLSNGVTEMVQQTISIMILIPIIGLLNLAAMFLFKNRRLQLRITMYNMFLMVGLTAMSAFILYRAFSDYNAVILPNVSMVFPIISAHLIFCFEIELF